MKFVYNEEKNEAMRHILMMQPTVEEAKAKLDKDDTDAAAWYEYGTALSLVGKKTSLVLKLLLDDGWEIVHHIRSVCARGSPRSPSAEALAERISGSSSSSRVMRTLQALSFPALPSPVMAARRTFLSRSCTSLTNSSSFPF